MRRPWSGQNMWLRSVLGRSPRVRCKRPERFDSSKNFRNLFTRGWRLKHFRYPYAWLWLQCENQSQGFGNKAFSKGKHRGATCSIRLGTFANHVGRTELQSIRWLSLGLVPEEEKCQAVSEPGDVIAIAKRWWNLWGNYGYSWAWHFGSYREADDF